MADLEIENIKQLSFLQPSGEKGNVTISLIGRPDFDQPVNFTPNFRQEFERWLALSVRDRSLVANNSAFESVWRKIKENRQSLTESP